jgi:SAM-dependent methyltransferase
MIPDVDASAFVREWTPRIFARVAAPARALDLAMGRGRHTALLARTGFRAFGVDRHVDAVRDGVRAAAAEQLTIRAWCADLECVPLPVTFFDLVLVTRYLQRTLIPAIADTIVPGGFIVYETFTVHQRTQGRGPTSPDHLLEPGELSRSFPGFEIVFSEEVREPDAIARLVARKT